jgi:hypothetical protein
MLRGLVAAFCILGVSQALEAGEICIACDEPVATYRCTFEQTAHDHRLQLGDEAQGHICEKVLKQAGPHASCTPVQAAEGCEGAPRTVTVADYQRLVMSDGHSTYQPGVLEKAQKGVNATWDCLASLFGDC